ncbi:50S ribosomal protein L34 [Candidatus Dojkabacteria bacterium]|mgnify:CR=1 FL=1|nr:50S ribosomal protein L34 [Candidatus Dojkabacteria bacterium]
MSKTQGPTYKPSKIKRIRKFGFRGRIAKKGGAKVLKARRTKGRHALTASSEFGSKVQKNKKFSRRRR